MWMGLQTRVAVRWHMVPNRKDSEVPSAAEMKMGCLGRTALCKPLVRFVVLNLKKRLIAFSVTCESAEPVAEHRARRFVFAGHVANINPIGDEDFLEPMHIFGF